MSCKVLSFPIKYDPLLTWSLSSHFTTISPKFLFKNAEENTDGNGKVQNEMNAMNALTKKSSVEDNSQDATLKDSFFLRNCCLSEILLIPKLSFPYHTKTHVVKSEK